VLILSQYVEPHYAMRLIEEHPERVGYLLKERVFDVANLIDALRRLADGETVIDPTIVARLFARKRRADPLDKLTEREREREVLALAVEGALQPGHRRPPVRHRAHHRSTRQADLPQADLA
jgi:DNA-binding NarL/FixJ family response regulator